MANRSNRLSVFWSKQASRKSQLAPLGLGKDIDASSTTSFGTSTSCASTSTSITTCPSSRRRRTKTYIRRIFRGLLPPVPESVPPKEDAGAIIRSPSKLSKHRKSQSITIPIDPLVHRPLLSPRDSGYYSLSVSPTPSFPSLCSSLTNPPSITISHPPHSVTSPFLLRKLHQSITKAINELEHQEELTRRFNVNLEYLLTKKEGMVVRSGKINDDMKEILVIRITKMRGVIERAVVRKGWLSKRGLEVLSGLKEQTAGGEGVGEVDNRSIDSGIGSEDEGDIEKGLEIIDAELKTKMQVIIKTLRGDIRMQTKLDRVLRDGVVEPCLDVRFIGGRGGRSESVMLGRFVGFVDGRVGELWKSYGVLEECLLDLEGLIGG